MVAALGHSVVTTIDRQPHAVAPLPDEYPKARKSITALSRLPREAPMAAPAVFPQPPDPDDYDGGRRWHKYCKLETIEARHRHLTKVTGHLRELAALKHLDVGDNGIESFERNGDHEGLETLAVYSNNLCSLELPRFGNLRFLGVGYNRIEALPITLGDRCPLLEAFDGYFNHLSSLDASLDALGGCVHLKQCVLAGNPCALLPQYRKRVAHALHVVRLDDLVLSKGEDDVYGDDETISVHVTLRALLGLDAPAAASDAADPTEEGVFVEFLIVGAPPATARRTARLPWRAALLAPPAPDAPSPPSVDVVLGVPASAVVRDGLKSTGLLVSVLKATPAAEEDGAEALAVVAAATVPLAALLEPSFSADSRLVETGALAFEAPGGGGEGSVTLAVRLNPPEDVPGPEELEEDEE